MFLSHLYESSFSFEALLFKSLFILDSCCLLFESDLLSSLFSFNFFHFKLCLILFSGSFLLGTPFQDLLLPFESVLLELFFSLFLGKLLLKPDFIKSLFAFKSFQLELGLPFEATGFGFRSGFVLSDLLLQAVGLKRSISLSKQTLVVPSGSLTELLQGEHSIGVMVTSSEDGL